MPAIRTPIVTGRNRSGHPYQTTVMVSAVQYTNTVKILEQIHSESVVAANNLLDCYRLDRRQATAKIGQQATAIEDLTAELAASRLKLANIPQRTTFRIGGSKMEKYYLCDECLAYTPTEYPDDVDIDPRHFATPRKLPVETEIDMSEIDYD